MSSPSASLTLQGKTAIVTGGSRGIGAQIAYELASRGAKVVITYTSPSSEKGVDDLMSRILSLNNTSSATKIQADLRQLSSPGKIVEATLSAFGPHIDILVNNAGQVMEKPLSDTTYDDYAAIYDLNVRAVLFMIKAVSPHLRSPGRVINISSVGARSGFKDLTLYCSSKAAVEGLTRCLAAELGSQGHTVNAVNPGPVQTDIMEGVPQELVEMQRNATPVENRLGTTDDIAQIVGFLAEERSRWITGQAISSSGGYAMY